MDSFREVDYDPFADEVEETPPEAVQPAAPPLREPKFEEGDPLVEVGKGIGAGAIGVVSSAIGGAAAGRVDYKVQRAKELARHKAVSEAGFPENTIDLPPEEQQKVRDIAAKADQSVEIPDILQDPYYRTHDEIKKWTEDNLRAAADYENTWTRTLSEGLGSTIPFMASSALGPAGAMVVGGAGGSMASAGEAIDRAVAGGASREEIIAATKLGSLPGVTDQLAIEAIFSKVPLPVMGRFATVVGKILTKAAVEGGQEGAQQAAQNLIEKYTYDPEQAVGEGVLENAVVGAIIGGAIGAPGSVVETVHERKPDQVNVAVPPGVEDSDTAAADAEGQGTPGGVGVAAPPPTTAAPKKGRVRKTPTVEVVTPGSVPSDVAAAAPGRTPEQVFAEQPEVPGAATEVAPETTAPTPAAAEPVPGTAEDTTGFVEVEGEPDFEEDGDVEIETAAPDEETPVSEDYADDDFDEDFDYGDESDEDAIAAVNSAAAARNTQVSEAGDDTTAALDAHTAGTEPAAEERQQPQVAFPEPPPTSGARFRQPQVEGVSQLQEQQQIPQVPGAEVSSAEPVPALEQPPTLPEDVAQVQEPVSAPANEPVIPGITPEAGAAVQFTEAVLGINGEPVAKEVDYQPEFTEEPADALNLSEAPVDQTGAEIDLTASPDQAAPVLNLIGKQLAQTMRTDLNMDPVTEDPYYNNVVDQVAAELTEQLQKGQAPAAVVRNLKDMAVEMVRNRLQGIQREAQTREAVVEETKQQRAIEVSKARTVRRAGAVKGKAKEEVAVESDRAFENRAKAEEKKPEAEQDPDLIAYRKLQVQRGKNKGPGSARKTIRESYTKKMAEHRQRYTERQAPKPEEKKVGIVPSAEKMTSEQREKLEQSVQPKSAAKKIEEAIAREEKTREPVNEAFKSVGPATELHARNREAGTKYLNDLYTSVKAALKAADDQIGTHIDPVHQSMQENLAIFAKQILDGKHKGKGVIDILTAQIFAADGDRKNFYGIMGEGSRVRGEQAIGDTSFAVDPETGDIISKQTLGGRKNKPQFQAMSSGPSQIPTEVVSVGDKQLQTVDMNGNPVTINYVSQASGRRVIDSIKKYLPKGFAGIIRKMHINALEDLVGDVPIYFVPRSEMAKITGTVDTARGLAYGKTPAQLAHGETPYILLEDEGFQYEDTDAQASHVVIHEMTHAATMFALNNNFRGTRDITAAMRLALKQQLLKAGIYDALPFNQRYGFTDDHEFLTEAFSNPLFQELLMDVDMPPQVANILSGLRSDRAPRWWDAFVSLVQNALSMTPFRKRGQNYLEGVLQLHSETMMSLREQTERGVDIAFGGADMRPNSEYGPRVQHPMSAQPMMRELNERLEAKAKEKFNPRGQWFRRNGARFGTTGEIKRRAQDLFGGIINPFGKWTDMLLSKNTRLDERKEAGNKVTEALQDFERKNRQASQDLSDVLHNATLAQVDPSVPLSHANNSHINKKGLRHNHRRNAHAKLSAQYQALPAEAKKLFKEVTAHYKSMNDQRVYMVVKNILQAAINKNGVKLPAGTNVDQAIDWVIDGKIDRKPEEQDAYDKAMHEALGKTGKSLKGTREMRKIKGTYVPLTRWGKYFFTAQQKVDVPAGATVDPESPDGNTFIFTDKKAADAYTKNTDDQVESVVSRWFDPKTDKRDVKANEDTVQRIYVTVQNKIMEMSDSLMELERKINQYEQAGYTTSKPDQIENHLHSQSTLLPAHVQALLRNLDQSTTSDANKSTARAAIVSTYIRQMAGSRAQHRQLKRLGIKGFNKDLVQATNTNNAILAGQITNLERAPEIAELEEEVKKYMHDERYSNLSGDRYDGLRRRALYNEILRRFELQNTYNESFTGQRVVNFIMEVSFFNHLASLAYSITNMTQPFMDL